MFGARIITEYERVPFHMSDDKQLYEFLKDRKNIHIIEERFSEYVEKIKLRRNNLLYEIMTP